MLKPLISPFGSFQKNFPKRIKKAGLCYSELVTLQKLWESANKEQKRAVLQNVTTIKKCSAKVPQEAGVGGMELFQPKKRKILNKKEILHIKT